jgi:hypothetical protein
MDVGVTTDPADRIATIRDVCYRDLCSESDLAAALSLSGRTLRRYVARGMPVVMICRRRYFEPEAVSAWLRKNCRAAKIMRARPRGKGWKPPAQQSGQTPP